MVIAGAGTGKTVTLVQKISSVMAWGKVLPEKILVLTFSRKAAEELKERLIRSAEGNRLSAAGGITAGTFHSYALSLLKHFSEEFIREYGFNAFPKVIEDADKERLIGSLIKERRRDFLGMPDATVRRSVERDAWTAEDIKKLKATGLDKAFGELKSAYINAKKALSLIDFDDIIAMCCGLLEKRRKLLREIQEELDFILVDEYQDTSDDNFRFLKLLTDNGRKNLFAVGDDWQSIYGFRNAKVEYILNMKKFFPNLIIHKLTVNYRSKSEIVSVSNRFIKGNKKRTRKKLSSFRGKGGIVKHWGVESASQELELLGRLTQETKGELAILYRNNWQGDIIRKALPELEARSETFMMTMHASKGLEFDTVIIVGVREHIIPDRTTPIEEERRLFYVALSRARDRLYVISTKNDDGSLPMFGKELSVPALRNG